MIKVLKYPIIRSKNTFFFSRYWLEEAEKIYPSNKILKRLREKIFRAKEGLEELEYNDNQDEELNGNSKVNESDDSTFWLEFTH